MTFLQLFWAHFMHSEMRWVNALLAATIVGLVVAAFAYDVGVPLTFYLKGIAFLVFMPLNIAYFYAKAQVPLDEKNRGNFYFFNAPWRIFIAQQLSLVGAAMVFLLLVQSPFWIRAPLILLPIIGGIILWRLFKKIRHPKQKS